MAHVRGGCNCMYDARRAALGICVRSGCGQSGTPVQFGGWVYPLTLCGPHATASQKGTKGRHGDGCECRACCARLARVVNRATATMAACGSVAELEAAFMVDPPALVRAIVR